MSKFDKQFNQFRMHVIPKATLFIKEFRSGSSLPLLVEADDGAHYVIKLHGSGEGKLSMMTGLISSRIAELLGVAVLSESLMYFDPSIIPSDVDPEIIELARRSKGINIATRFLPDAKPFDPQETTPGQKEQEWIFLTDLLLMNIDRTVKNPNILCSDGAAFCYDYSMSMSVRRLFENTLGTEQNLLPFMKRHLFWREDCHSEDFISGMRSLHPDQIQHIVEVIPDEWLSAVSIPAFTDKLFRDITNSDEFMNNLERLRLLPYESDEEIRQKNQRSRQAFMDKFGKI